MPPTDITPAVEHPTITEQFNACVKESQKFWKKTAGYGDLAFIRSYIRDLLPQEIEVAAARHRLPDLTKPPFHGHCDILVLLVGHSYEPLLQAICAYRPREIVLVLNAEYGDPEEPKLGKDVYSNWRRLLPTLVETFNLAPDTHLREVAPLQNDTPTAVFRFLLEQLRADWGEKTIVVDITGAKKCMVSGAFFFAAYANINISYVDVEYYNDKKGYQRPYGCSCKIGLIDNPYRKFLLRDWAEVQRLYSQYAFNAARDRVKSILPSMAEEGFFAPEEIVSAKKLQHTIEVLALWDSGSYRRTWKTLAEKVPWLTKKASLPWAISHLGNSPWPDATEGKNSGQAARKLLDEHLTLKRGEQKMQASPKPAASIFARDQGHLLVAYVYDELAKIQRLHHPKEDYRAAFLRAVALDEFLLKARLAFCWIKGEILDESRKPIQPGTASWRQGFHHVVKHSGMDEMRYFLCGAYKFLSLNRHKLYLAIPKPNLMKSYWETDAFEIDLAPKAYEKYSVLAKLRAEVVHTSLYVTPSIAQQAITLAELSAEEFKTWLKRYYPARYPDFSKLLTMAPEWKDLCEWCGIDFLPPYLEEANDD